MEEVVNRPKLEEPDILVCADDYRELVNGKIRWERRFWTLLWVIITPEEDGTMEIEIHTRHFFAADTITEIKAMKTDYGIYQWMQKGKDGQWWPAFQWNDYNDGSP